MRTSPGLSMQRFTLKQMLDYIRIDELNPAYSAALKLYWARYGEPMKGSTRAVFATGTGHVIKVPYSYEGQEANLAEAAHWAAGVGVPLAPTELLGVDQLPSEVVSASAGSDLVIVRATEVQIVPEGYEVPPWAHRLKDGPQVGWLPDGTLVAYDL